MKRPISYTANNAAKKDTFVGMLYEKGVQQTKNEILTQIKKRLQDNPCDDCLNGLKHTIEKIEQYFIED